MSFSEAAICNIALRRIGVTQSIDALTDATTEAEACTAVYRHTLETLLTAGAWGFATTRADLALITDNSADPVGGWSYVYALPANCITALRIFVGDLAPIHTAKVPFTIEYDSTSGRVLMTNEETTTTDAVSLEYVKYVDNPAIFPPLFRDALAWALAAELAMALSVEDNRAARSKQMAELMRERALSASMNEQHIPTPDSELIAGRS